MADGSRFHDFNADADPRRRPFRCGGCERDMHRDDEAAVCIECGGRNRRIDPRPSWRIEIEAVVVDLRALGRILSGVIGSLTSKRH